MTIEQQYEERCPLWCRFFVPFTTNFAPCAARNAQQKMFRVKQSLFIARRPGPAALKSVVDVPRETFEVQCSTYNGHWAMKCEQCFMF